MTEEHRNAFATVPHDATTRPMPLEMAILAILGEVDYQMTPEEIAAELTAQR